MWFWMNSSYSLSAESVFIRLLSIARVSFFKEAKHENEYLKSKTLFVNAESEGVQVKNLLGNERIVDRTKIDTLIQLLNLYPSRHRTLLCDLIFDIPQPVDSAFAKTLSKTPNFYWPTPAEGTSELLKKAVPERNSGYASYSSSNEWLMLSDGFNKFPLINGDKKSLVLRMYEASVGDTSVFKYGGMIALHGKRYSNMVIVDESLRSYDIQNDEISMVYPIQQAIDLLKGDDEFSRSLLKKEYVVIGDFENDIHKTSMGDVAGPLINMNLYFSLLKEEGRISLSWIVFVLISLTAIIHYSLYAPTPVWMNKLQTFVANFTGGPIENLIGISILMLSVSIISFLSFSIKFETVPCAMVINLIFTIRRLWANIKNLPKGLKGWPQRVNFILFNHPYKSSL